MNCRAAVKKGEFTVSGDVDSAAWFRPEEALTRLREGSIAWQLVREVMYRQDSLL